jgi:1,4-dihydroxy-6-naphthoate synthase
VTTLSVGHSPDPDDAFMFWAVASGRVDAEGLELVGVAADIQTLNERALAGELEVTAMSAAAYPYVAERYALLPHGASLGVGYGPIVVVRPGTRTLADLEGARIATPGTMTTAFLVGRLALPPFEAVHTAFDEIPDAVLSGDVDAGILIHEGQLTYADLGLEKLLDLGAWWEEETGMPLPLGAVAIRRDLDPAVAATASRVLARATELGLEHRGEALDYARGFGRGIASDLNDRFVAMYVNDYTRDYGEQGRAAVAELLRRGAEAGACPAVQGDVFFAPDGNA